jgi:hypothetical protein
VSLDTRTAVDLFKRGLESLDDAPFVAWLDQHRPLDEESAAELRAFVNGERARLVKLRSLGLTRGTEERLALVERIRAALKSG